MGARLARTVLGLMILLVVASCGGSAPIRIGLLGTFGDPLGLPQRFGARLAVSQINAAVDLRDLSGPRRPRASAGAQFFHQRVLARSSDSGHGILPGGGHEFCPLAAMRTAR